MNGGGVAPWLPGDRLPDVVLRDLDSGETPRLHARFAGVPLWLALPGPQSPAEPLPAPPPGVTALWLVADANALRPPMPGWLALQVDPGWLRPLRAGAGDAGVGWIADGNLRLLRSGPLAAFAGELGQATTAGEPLPAPVLLIPGVFEPELCAAAIRHFERDCGGGEASRVMVHEGGQAAYALDPAIKQRRESGVRDPALEARMHERLLRRALPEIERVFQFRVARRDPFKLLAYAAGAGYFNAHRDNETPDVAHRRFALSINLDAGAYQGGAFRFPEFGPGLYAPATGTALVFSCALLHAVTPVETGCRHAMTTFLA